MSKRGIKTHEMSITGSVLDIAGKEMKKHHVSRLKCLKIRVGELTAVEPDALRFCFEACVKGTPMEGAILEIEEVQLTGRCALCGAVFRIEGCHSVCPACYSASIEKITGAELDIVSMEAV